jgi:hypothetical protein
MATIMGNGVGGPRRAMAWFKLPWVDSGPAAADTRPGAGNEQEPVDIDLDALASLPSVHWLGNLVDPVAHGDPASGGTESTCDDDDWRTRPAVTLRTGQAPR